MTKSERVGCVRRRGVGFTLIELMVVAAIIAALLVVTMPAIKGLLQTSQLAQADNLLRASLYSARTYAVHQSVVGGLRCQDDGNLVQIYARNSNQTYSRDNYTEVPVYDMMAVAGIEPEQVPDPWRVTVRDVGVCDRMGGSGSMEVTWLGRTAAGYPAATRWLGGEHPWFVFPVVLFSPQGRVILADCKFSGSSSRPWYPTLEGSFGAVTDADSNTAQDGPVPGQPQLRYTNQVAMVGWRCNGYKGSGSHDIPVESPSVSAALRIFNYKEFQGTTDKSLALLGIISSASDCVLDVNTGLPVRRRANQMTGSN